mgnify:FL=1
MVFEHTPVLPEEVFLHQNLKPGDVAVDGTLGGCGHALRTIEAILPDGLLIGIDQDRDAIDNARDVLRPYKDNVLLVHDNFSNLSRILKANHIEAVNSILVDLGFSLHQIEKSKRGFSFNKEEPLDMRMDIRHTRTAADIIHSLKEKELADLFYHYGEERFSRRIARRIVAQRQNNPISTSKDLAAIVAAAVPTPRGKRHKIHPATRVFQALRIAVNRELDVLKAFMAQIPDVLKKDGRVSIISFHSLEDRIVKQSIRNYEQGCTCPKGLPQCICGFEPRMKAVFKKPVIAKEAELETNPMARSAKLRVAKRV